MDSIKLVAACLLFFFFNDTATTEIYTLSLHDALPISAVGARRNRQESHRVGQQSEAEAAQRQGDGRDRKSTRLNSSHANISYAVFCLKKKKKKKYHYILLLKINKINNKK